MEYKARMRNVSIFSTHAIIPREEVRMIELNTLITLLRAQGVTQEQIINAITQAGFFVITPEKDEEWGGFEAPISEGAQKKSEFFSWE